MAVAQASRSRLSFRRLAFAAGVAAVAIWLLGPILWMAITSLQPEAAVTTAPPELTWNLHVGWYSQFLQDTEWLKSTLVSLEVAVATTAATLVVGALAAYPLARLRVPGRNLIMALLIATQMMPPIVLLIPVLFMAREVHLTDTVAALVLVNTAFLLPLVIWLLFNFFREVPSQLNRPPESTAAPGSERSSESRFRLPHPGSAQPQSSF